MGVFCIQCNTEFSNQSNINRHIRNVHGVNDIQPIGYNKDVALFKCLEGCDLSFKYNMDLRQHLEKKHNFHMEIFEKTFATYEEFKTWLRVEEKNEDIRYEKSTGSKRRGESTIEKVYFDCVRSGKERKISEQNLKRSTKSQGSSKIGKHCTSQIIIIKHDSGECSMKYFRNHYGHGHDVQHLRLSKITRENIASKLIMGVSSEYIVNSTRDNITPELKRDDLLTRSDIKNIKNSYNINLKDGYRHQNDAVSVDLWVREMKESSQNPIVFYKKQDEILPMYDLNRNDFCIILISPTQKELLSRFGKNIICVDSTHGLNPYDFELTTILIIDEFRQGFPAAFMFTNRKDTYINEIFFKEIQKVVGTLDARVFMSDMTNVFCNAWKNVNGPVEYELFCSWHVDRAWQQNLKKILDTETRKWVYKTLKYLQTTTEELEFEAEFPKFLDILSSKPETMSMFNYIQMHYSNNTHKWAYCYRKKAKINTNMHIENMHKLIKYIYLEGKKVRRLDKSLNALQKFLRDKIIDRIIKLTKGKTTQHHNIIHARHRNALTLKFEVEKVHECSYLLKDAENKTFLVSKNKCSMCCALNCRFCKICVHSFGCTCLDYVIKHTICKHIHYVGINTYTELLVNELDSNVKGEVNNLVRNIGLSAEQQSHRTILEEIKSTAFQVIDNVSIKPQSLGDLQQILRNLKAAALISSNSTNHDVEILNKIKSVAEPGNKKIEKQVFFSTKKLRKNANLQNKKPNKAEKQIIKELLTSSPCTSKDPRNDHLY